MSKILVIGRATIDFNPVDINRSLDQSTTFKKYVGGSAANIAIGLKRLGQEVGLVTCVSTDQFGSYVYDYLIEEGIDCTGIVKDKKCKTGLTFTEILSSTESSILMYRDKVADLNLQITDINKNQIKEYDVLLVTGTSLASSESREAVFYALELAKKYNKKIVFDLDYREYTWKSSKSTALAYHMVASESEIVIGSVEEFKFMDEISGLSDVEQYANYFLNQKAKHIIIKNGKLGSKYFSNDKKYKVNIFPVELVKSFGGGDAYVSKFLSGLEDDLNIVTALFEATAHAAMLVNSHSCSEALATRTDIIKFILNTDVEEKSVIEEIYENS